MSMLSSKLFTKPYVSLWFKDLLILLCLAIVSIFVFRLTSLDIDLLQPFYRDGEWFMRSNKFFNFLYSYGSWPASIIVIISIFLLTISYFKTTFIKYRIHLIFLVVLLLTGPGLIVNAVLKIHWGRPRPAEIKEFDGKRTFLPLLVKGESGKGKSFTCGHCSMGFYFFAFYFLFRRKKFRVALVFLILTLFYGLAIGLARMAFGGHFPSDVLWTMFIMFFVALFLYYFIFKIPLREDTQETVTYNINTKKKVLYTVLNGLIVFIVLVGLALLTPVYTDVEHIVKPSKNGPLDLSVNCKNCFLSIELTDSMEDLLAISGKVYGFGLPTNNMTHTFRNNENTIDFTLWQEGLYIELDIIIDMKININTLEKLTLNTMGGHVKFKTPDNHRISFKSMELSLDGKNTSVFSLIKD